MISQGSSGAELGTQYRCG